MGAPAAALNRRCPVCDGDTHAPFGSKGALQLVRCQVCSMIFANPVSAEFTEGAFYRQLAKPFYLSPDKLESDYAPVRYARELRWFRRYCMAGHVLDVGCSTGAFLYQVKKQWPDQYQVLGTDMVKEALNFAVSRGVPVLQQAFLEYEPGDDAFDAVTFWAVLEHLEHPKQFLAKAAQLLKPGGYCFLLVPNWQSLAVRLLGTRYRYVMPEHVNYFTPSTLQKFAAGESRLEVVKLTSTHFNPMVIWQDWRAPRERVPDDERAQLLKRTTKWKENPLVQPLQAVYRQIELILGCMKLADNLLMVLRRKSGTSQ